MSVLELGKQAKRAASSLALLSNVKKNAVLQKIAEGLEQQQESILQANADDVKKAEEQGLSAAMIDRLTLTPERLQNMAQEVRKVMQLPDPIGRVIDGGRLDSGLLIRRECVPLGVVGVIYESRPNVTIDVASLCLKTGNAVILRGGKETRETNKALLSLIQSALSEEGVESDSVQMLPNFERDSIRELLQLERYVDVIIPRGGEALQAFCREHARVPVMTGGIGVCHIFVEESALVAESLEVIKNAKTQRPSTCNTVETLLVQKSIAKSFLPKLAKYLGDEVCLHVDKKAYKYLEGKKGRVQHLSEEQLSHEWLSYDLNVVVVKNFQSALEHIATYGTAHSEAILTQNPQLAREFVQRVDAAAVYVNASTRFTDGAQFGLGAEVAVSTQKLHARGPMGLEALTTYKWIVEGKYAVRA
ncbi:MAG: glutamate-5-semialdehyde dehydrogenase [Cardiobacteriaceae bacterium]|nr:glutamate-5-semialdehyde dehydrogenase [Cardiobacteriaceae bacterium]